MVFDALQNSDHSGDIDSTSSPPIEPTDIAIDDPVVPLIEPLFEKSAATNKLVPPVAPLEETDSAALYQEDAEGSDIEESAEEDFNEIDAGTQHVDSNDLLPQVDIAPPEVSFATRPSHQYRYLWALLSLFLCILLTAQYAILYKDKLAANFSGIAPAVNALCNLSNCRVQLPADLDLVKITSTAFEADTVNPNLISVHIGLENQSNMRVTLPNLALTLTNDEDEIVVKRNFHPTEYLVKPSTEAEGIAAHAETTAHLIIDSQGTSVSGYKVSIFYDRK